MDWPQAPTQPATAAQAAAPCPHCRGAIAVGAPVRACPECGVVLHAACFTDTEGGRAFATDNCGQCLARTYWR